MRRVEALVLLSTLFTSIHAAEGTRPRGVGPEFGKFYKGKDSFSCISNPSITLSPSQINDEYCDCPDGSDEPGTAACTYLSGLSPPQPLAGAENTTLALPGFYCKNKGHLPGYIPHMYVNDGVCDYELCCDGSDEWEAVGGTKCEDRCKEIGKEWRRLDDIKTKSLRAALKRKDGLLKDAGEKRAAIELGITRLESEIRGLESQEKDLKKVYEDVERRERGKVVGGSAGGKVSKVTLLAGLARARVEELRTTLLSVVEKKDKLKDKVKELEGILAKFKEERNPNFNDEGVKRAVQAWEDYAANRQGGDEDEAIDRDVQSVSQEDSESEGINWTEWETEGEESDVETLYAFEQYLPESLRSWMHQKIIDFRIMLVENGILADNANSGTESKAVSDARTKYQAVSDDLNSKQVKLGEEQTDLSKDYGPSDIFRALKNTCISKDSGEYEYELCWLDATRQKSKKGGGSTGMGNFVRIDKQTFDEEVGADGKGVGKGERIVLMYENGQHCWNGPNRQTTVVLACAEKDEIWKVVEQEKCMYRMDVGTAAVCEKAGGNAQAEGAAKKDEL